MPTASRSRARQGTALVQSLRRNQPCGGGRQVAVQTSGLEDRLRIGSCYFKSSWWQPVTAAWETSTDMNNVFVYKDCHQSLISQQQKETLEKFKELLKK